MCPPASTGDPPAVRPESAPVMSTTFKSEWRTEPFRHGTEAEFARVRALFQRAGYTDEAISRRAGVPSIHHLGSAEERGDLLRESIDAMTLLLHIFCDGEYIPWRTVREFLRSEEH